MALSNGISLTQKGGLSQGIPLKKTAQAQNTAQKPAQKVPASTEPVQVPTFKRTAPIGGYNNFQLAKAKGTPASRALG